MRLKTLRKERPAFENEGTVISGSRMDLSNVEYKPSKRRTNTLVALPATLNNDFSSPSFSVSDRANQKDINRAHQSSTLQILAQPTSSQLNHASSYQAIEAAYLEHGIRIHLNPITAAAVQQQQSQILENLTEVKSASSAQRRIQLSHRQPSRSSSALHYPTIVPDSYQESRPFSALQQTSIIDFDEEQLQNESYTQTLESQSKLRTREEHNPNYCSSSVFVSEHSNPTAAITQTKDTNDTKSLTTAVDTDPDLAYMSTLLKTNSGDSYRDTIRRRAGLRPTLGVHRHPQPSRASTNSKQQDKSPDLSLQITNHRSSTLRQPITATAPATNTGATTLVSISTVSPPSKKKIEKDILRHASRIRTSQLKDYFNRLDSSLKSYPSQKASSLSNSPTRLSHTKKRQNTKRAPKPITMEPLEILLAPSPRSIRSEAIPRVKSLPLRDLHDSNTNEYYNHEAIVLPRAKSSRSWRTNCTATTHDEIITNISLSEHSTLSSLNSQTLSIMKSSPLGITRNNKARQSTSFDSGCYDQCSSSGDTQSVASSSLNQTSSSVPSARLTSASTRRSTSTKKVSFEDPSRTFIVTTAIYV